MGLQRAKDPDLAAATLEDARFLLEHHVGLTEAARRLDFPSAEALEKWLTRRGELLLIRQLRAANPLPLDRTGAGSRAAHYERSAS